MLAKITLFATALALAPAAQAGETQVSPAPQVAVGYADLDLATEAGADRLAARIRAAVRAVCPADPGPLELARHRISTRCIAETTLRIEPRVAALVGAARMSNGANRQVAAR